MALFKRDNIILDLESKLREAYNRIRYLEEENKYLKQANLTMFSNLKKEETK